ncbi:hypothetical protein HDU90_004283 [Geranomyces variabilis]|nr:hypothetical protein HDU90_004283 [Geranomyces variabilis]
MVYPNEFFVFIEQGTQINSTANGLLLDVTLHGLFGKLWCMQAQQSEYTVVVLGPGRDLRDVSNKQIPFPSPTARPGPILVNLHGCLALAAAAWRSANLWAAEGERDLGILDDCGDEWDTIFRADVSKYGAGSHGDIEPLALGEPAV